jgi:UDP-2,3-diacylglucosamine pyrophosphatase LpxH
VTEAELADPLTTAQRIGFAGDIHGGIEDLTTCARSTRALDVSVLIVLGDFGVVWPGEDWQKNLNKLSRRLGALNVSCYFVDGNHEAFPLLYGFPVGADGLRRLRENVVHLPRGYRTTLASGKVLAALGGANSIDVEYRESGDSWWQEESIADADLATLGRVHADVLVGHDAPLHLPELDRFISMSAAGWSPAAVEYANAGRRMFHRGFEAVTPLLYLGGHYHQLVDEVVEYGDDPDSFTTRIVILDHAGEHRNACLAMLDVHSLDVEILMRSGDPVVSRGEKSCWGR